MAEGLVPCPTNANECKAGISEQFLTLHLLNDHQYGICELGTAEKHNPRCDDQILFLPFDGNVYVQAKDGLAQSLNKRKETLALACGCVWSYGDMNYSWYESGQKFSFRHYDKDEQWSRACPGPWAKECGMTIPNPERWPGHMLQFHQACACPLGGDPAKHIPNNLPDSMPPPFRPGAVVFMPDRLPYSKIDFEVDSQYLLKCGCRVDRRPRRM
jgi:hypothetical protein